MTSHILADEVVDNGRFEEFALVGNDMPNVELWGQVARIVEILGAVVLLVETEGHTDHLISRILQE